MSTTTQIVPASLYAIQTFDHTYIMVQAQGDKAVRLMAYKRACLAEAQTMTGIAVGGEPLPGDVVVLNINLKKPPAVPAGEAAMAGAALAGEGEPQPAVT